VVAHSGAGGRVGHAVIYGISGDTQSRHCLWLMFALSLSHSRSGQAAGPGHSRIVVSSLPETMRLPSGLKATLSTPSLCPVSGGPIGAPVSASHSRTVLSTPPETMRRPSRLKRHTEYPAGVPGQRGVDRRAGAGVPQPYRAIDAAGHDAAPVGAERHTDHLVGVPGQRGADLLAGAGVPQPHLAVVAAGDDAAAVGAERHTFHVAGVARERGADLLASVGIPQPHGLVVAAGLTTHAFDYVSNLRTVYVERWTAGIWSQMARRQQRVDSSPSHRCSKRPRARWRREVDIVPWV
jgi:hypothetical protein